MPNWVKSRVIAKDFNKLKECLLNEKGEVDFNILKPRPKDLDIECGSDSFVPPNSKLFSFGKNLKDYELILSKLDTKYDESLTQNLFVEKVEDDDELMHLICQNFKTDKIDTVVNYIKGYYNYYKYGHVDWYSWCIDNWDTKWNANSTEVYEDSGVIEFQTAWSMPHSIFLEIARYTPIRVEYADEDLGRNCGITDYFANKKGEPGYIELVDESVELAYDCWGYPEMDVYDENGDQIEDFNNPKVIEANKKYFEIQEELQELMNPLKAFGDNK